MLRYDEKRQKIYEKMSKDTWPFQLKVSIGQMFNNLA